MMRHPREHDEPHCMFIRTLPCVVCGDDTSTECCHVRMKDPTIAKPMTGIATKPHDKFTVPMCGKCHRSQHGTSEASWWEEVGIDPVKVALALYSVSGDYEQGFRIASRMN